MGLASINRDSTHPTKRFRDRFNVTKDVRTMGSRCQGRVYFGPQRTVRSRILPAASASNKPSWNQRVQPRGRRVSRRTPNTFRRFLALMVDSVGRKRRYDCSEVILRCNSDTVAGNLAKTLEIYHFWSVIFRGILMRLSLLFAITPCICRC